MKHKEICHCQKHILYF